MRRSTVFRSVVFMGAIAAMACGSDDKSESDDGAADNGESETGAEDSGGEGDGDGDDDGAGTGGECLFWVEDDCNSPELKCMPWSETANRIPDEPRCCMLEDNPAQVGDPCEIQNYDGSCLDDCAAGAMCVRDSPDALTGVCAAFCDPGSNDACNSGEYCKPYFEMIESAETVPLCMIKCDPIVQDCDARGRPGWSCLPEGELSPQFICQPPPTTAAPKMEYDVCLLSNDCAIGLACVPAPQVAGCSPTLFCCTQYCDLNGPDPCTDGNECIDLGAMDPGLQHVGACAIPQ